MFLGTNEKEMFHTKTIILLPLSVGWMNRTRWRWQILAWPEMFLIRSITVSRITGKLSCLSSGWPLRACRHRNSPPSQMWWAVLSCSKIKISAVTVNVLLLRDTCQWLEGWDWKHIVCVRYSSSGYPIVWPKCNCVPICEICRGVV